MKGTGILRATTLMGTLAKFSEELEDSPQMSRQDQAWDRAWSKADWGGSWRKHGNYAASRGKNRSAPMLPVRESPQAATWYSGKVQTKPSNNSCWRSLGATWRDWEAQDDHSRDAGEGSGHVHGCVPHWGKIGSVRVRGLLEHELTWAYYRMRRHEGHPQRKAVGEQLPADCVGEKMRFGSGHAFKFWRDLRPPFAIRQVKRVDDGLPGSREAPQGGHPDGDLHTISYDCAIEYFAERLLDDGSEAGTFGNKVYGVAQVRVPTEWPKKRPLRIISWGQPTLNPQESPASPMAKPSGRAGPKSKEENAPQKGQSRKKVEIGELKGLTLGKHASLPRLGGDSEPEY